MNTPNKAALAGDEGEGKRSILQACYPAPPSNTIMRPDRREWLVKKAQGDEGEEMVADFFRALGLSVAASFRPDFDLSVIGKIEVKTDLRARETGNIAIETSYRGRPSGLSTTLAGAWALVIDGEIILVLTGRLRALMKQYMHTKRPAGEGATVVLVPLQALRRAGFAVRWPARRGQ